MSDLQAKVIQVIEVISVRGMGVAHDPMRRFYQYWSLDGTLLAEADPFAPCRFETSVDGKLVDAGWILPKGHHLKKSWAEAKDEKEKR